MVPSTETTRSPHTNTPGAPSAATGPATSSNSMCNGSAPTRARARTSEDPFGGFHRRPAPASTVPAGSSGSPAMAGRRVERRRMHHPAARVAPDDGHGETAWHRYSSRVGRHPWRYLGAGVVTLSVLAIPMLSMTLGHVDAGANPTSYTDRRAYDAISRAFGPGTNRPFTVVVQLSNSDSGSTLATGLAHVLADAPGIATVSPVSTTADGALLVATVVPATRPQDNATDRLLAQLDDITLPRLLAGTGSRGYVTGILPGSLEFGDEVAARLPLIVAIVLAAAFMLLLVSFRSPVLALKAAVLNLFSIGAAYGVVVAVFQWGWGSSLLGVGERVPVESYVPMMMFAIVFELSMDYEVFLLCRFRTQTT